MVRNLVEVYLQVAIGLEARGSLDSAYYALGQAMLIEQSQLKQAL